MLECHNNSLCRYFFYNLYVIKYSSIIHSSIRHQCISNYTVFTINCHILKIFQKRDILDLSYAITSSIMFPWIASFISIMAITSLTLFFNNRHILLPNRPFPHTTHFLFICCFTQTYLIFKLAHT